MPPEFNWEISTILDGESGQPFVGLSIWYQEYQGPDRDDKRTLVGTWRWTIDEARQRGWSILQAAEASEVDAHMIVALREHKMPEIEIQKILESMRMNRGRA